MIVVVPYVLRIGGIMAFLLAAWSSLDWVHRAAGPGHTPAVVAGVVVGVATVVRTAWYVRQFRGAQAKRDWRRISLLIVVGVVAILAFASTGALLTGYEGAGGGAGIWPPVLRGASSASGTSTLPPLSTPDSPCSF